MIAPMRTLSLSIALRSAAVALSMLAGLGARPTAAQQAVPEIRFDANVDFLKLPANMYLGEVAGVAIDARRHLFVFTSAPGAQHAARRGGRAAVRVRARRRVHPRDRQGSLRFRVRAHRAHRQRRQYLGDGRRHEHDHEVRAGRAECSWCSAGVRKRSRRRRSRAPGQLPRPRWGTFNRPTDVAWDRERQHLRRRRLQQLARREDRQERPLGENVGRARQRGRVSSTSCTRSPTTRRATSTSPIARTAAFRCSIRTARSCGSSRSTCRSRSR